jgi:nucleotide-binding universal stress UspA family protein
MKTILVPTDFNELATAALRHAALIAQSTGAEIIVLYADRFVPPTEFTATQAQALADAIAESRRLAGEELQAYAAGIVPEGVKFTTIIREDFPVPAIVRLAEETNADLIVMGTHGRGGISRVLLGSVAEAVLRDTKRPVLTVRKTTPALPIRKIACADADSSDFADALVHQLRGELTPRAEEADLIVACEQNKTLIRESRIPVLTVRG